MRITVYHIGRTHIIKTRRCIGHTQYGIGPERDLVDTTRLSAEVFAATTTELN